MNRQRTKLLYDEIGDFGFVTEDDGRVFLCRLRLMDQSPILSHEKAAQVIARLQESYRDTHPSAIEDYNREIEAQKTHRPETAPMERKPKAGFIYLAKAENGLYKIGLTSDLKTRIRAIQNGNLLKVELVHTITTKDMLRAEKTLHARFAKQRSKREWFALTLQDVDDIKSIASL